MARRPDPIRIETARRSATIARLVSAGHAPATAARLVAQWEDLRIDFGRPPDRTDWEGFDTWLATRRPPT
jgi:hypothetical protein